MGFQECPPPYQQNVYLVPALTLPNEEILKCEEENCEMKANGSG